MNAPIIFATAVLAIAASAGGQSLSRYSPHLDEADYSGFRLTDGGVITAPYRLVSGPDINGGADITVSFYLSELSAGRDWLMLPANPAFGLTSNMLTFDAAWVPGQDTTVTASLYSVIPSIPGYAIDSQNLYLSGLANAIVDYPNTWLKTSPPSKNSHFDTMPLQWDLTNIDTNGSRTWVDRFDFKNRYIHASVDPRDTYITFASPVPETSAAPLGGLGTLSLLRRRRSA